jgi:pilus assembly protein Flp/PilA
MKKFLVSLLKDESGLTTVEYAVGAAVVVAAGVGIWVTLGEAVGTKITALTGAVNAQ